MILFSSLNTIHKVFYKRKPPSMVSLYRINTNERKVKNVATKYIPLSTKMKNFYIYKYSKIYNSLDQYIKDKTYKGFKNEMKLIIRAGTISDSMD